MNKFILLIFCLVFIGSCGSSGEEEEELVCIQSDYGDSQVSNIEGDSLGIYFSVGNELFYTSDNYSFSLENSIGTVDYSVNGVIGLSIQQLADNYIATSYGDVFSQGEYYFSMGDLYSDSLLTFDHTEFTYIVDSEKSLSSMDSDKNIIKLISSDLMESIGANSILAATHDSDGIIYFLARDSDSNRFLTKWDGSSLIVLYSDIGSYGRIIFKNDSLFLISPSSVIVLDAESSTISDTIELSAITNIAIDGEHLVLSNNIANYYLNTISLELSELEYDNIDGAISSAYIKDEVKYIGTTLGMWKIDSSGTEQIIDTSSLVSCIYE